MSGCFARALSGDRREECVCCRGHHRVVYLVPSTGSGARWKCCFGSPFRSASFGSDRRCCRCIDRIHCRTGNRPFLGSRSFRPGLPRSAHTAFGRRDSRTIRRGEGNRRLQDPGKSAAGYRSSANICDRESRTASSGIGIKGENWCCRAPLWLLVCAGLLLTTGACSGVRAGDTIRFGPAHRNADRYTLGRCPDYFLGAQVVENRRNRT
jgi:hypothetical protein